MKFFSCEHEGVINEINADFRSIRKNYELNKNVLVYVKLTCHPWIDTLLNTNYVLDNTLENFYQYIETKWQVRLIVSVNDFSDKEESRTFYDKNHRCHNPQLEEMINSSNLVNLNISPIKNNINFNRTIDFTYSNHSKMEVSYFLVE